jgi:hypothetical protein
MLAFALSYCWRTSEWHPVTEAHQPLATEEPIPISRRLWQSLLDILELYDEAIWIDQLCLDQTDRLEKTSAAASIDTLYASETLFWLP